MTLKLAGTLPALVLLAAIGGTTGLVQAGEGVYLTDQRDAVVRSAYGLCWRTGYWTPAAAALDKVACACDRELLAKDACEPPHPPPAPPGRDLPELGPKPSVEKVSVAADALFDFNKAVLRPAGKARLDEVAARAKAIKLEAILVVGHSDRIGAEAYNQKLSEKRAAVVKAYLAAQGLEANRITAEGRGEKQPLSGDQCRGERKSRALIDCLQQDRRVDIEVIGSR